MIKKKKALPKPPPLPKAMAKLPELPKMEVPETLKNPKQTMQGLRGIGQGHLGKFAGKAKGIGKQPKKKR